MGQSRNEELLKGNVCRALVRFAIPFLLANLLQVLYGATDLIVVGHFASTADTSAVSIGSQIMSMVTYMILGLSTGATVLLGQYFGAGQEDSMRRTTGTAIWMFSGIALGMTALLFLFRNGIIFAMNTPAEAISATGDYLRICSAGTVFIVGYNLVSGILRGLGDSKTPLLFVAIAAGINIVLDIVLVKFFSMGAAGAALATVFAQAVSLLFSLFYLGRRGLSFSFGRRDLHFHGAFARKILKTGFPIALQSCLVSLSFLLITLVINRMGLVASAAVGVVEKLFSFLMLPSNAFSSAVSAMSAQNFGAGQFGRARQSMRIAIGISFVFGVLVAVFSQFFGTSLTALVNGDPEVIRAAAQYLSTYSLDCILIAFVFNMNGYFTGAGHTLFAMAHNVAATFAIRIPATLLLSRFPGATLATIGLAIPLSSLGSLLLCLGYFWWLNRHPERLVRHLAAPC